MAGRMRKDGSVDPARTCRSHTACQWLVPNGSLWSPLRARKQGQRHASPQPSLLGGGACTRREGNAGGACTWGGRGTRVCGGLCS